MATGKLFGLFFMSLGNKLMDLDSDDMRVSLHTSTYTPNQDTHDFFDDATNEVVGTGYTAGGVALTGETMAYNAGSNTWTLDANDAQWPSSTITARYAVVYDRTPATDATRPLVGYQDFVTDAASAAGLFEIVWNAGGIVSVVVA